MTWSLYWLLVPFALFVAACVWVWTDHRLSERSGRPRPDPQRFAERERFGGIDPNLQLTDEDRRIIRERDIKRSLVPRASGGFTDDPIVFKRHNPDHKSSSAFLPNRPAPGGHRPPPRQAAPRSVFGGLVGAGHYHNPPAPLVDPGSVALGMAIGSGLNDTPAPAAPAPVAAPASCPDTGFVSSYDSGGGFDGGGGGSDGGGSGGGGE